MKAKSPKKPAADPVWNSHKAAFPYPEADDPGRVGIEVQSVRNRAPDAKELATALRRLAAPELDADGKFRPTEADQALMKTELGKLITGHAVHRKAASRPDAPRSSKPPKGSPHEEVLTLEYLIAHLADGDIVGALECMMGAQFRGFTPHTSAQRGGYKGAVVRARVNTMEELIDKEMQVQERVAELVKQGHTKKDARQTAADESGLKVRQVEDMTRGGGAGRPKRG